MKPAHKGLLTFVIVMATWGALCAYIGYQSAARNETPPVVAAPAIEVRDMCVNGIVYNVFTQGGIAFAADLRLDPDGDEDVFRCGARK